MKRDDEGRRESFDMVIELASGAVGQTLVQKKYLVIVAFDLDSHFGDTVVKGEDVFFWLKRAQQPKSSGTRFKSGFPARSYVLR